MPLKRRKGRTSAARALAFIEDLVWAAFPAAILLSISAGQALAIVLFVFWLLNSASRRILPGYATAFLAFLCWALLTGIASDTPGSVTVLSKWPVLFMAPVAFGWAAAGAGRVRRPLLVLLLLTAAVLPWSVWNFFHTEYARARAFSGGAPNLGTNLMMAAVVFLAAFFQERARSRLLWLAGVILAAAGLALTLNRAALLGAGIALLVLALRLRPALLFAALAALVLYVGAAPQSPVSWRLRTIVRPDTSPTAGERLLMWRSGLRMVRDRPLVGAGTRGNFIRLYSTGYRNPRSAEARPGHVHNSFIQAAVLHGVPGLGLLLWLLAVLWRNIRAAAAAERSPDGWTSALALALPALFAAAMVNSCFDFVLADGQRALMFYALTGLLLGAGFSRAARRRRAR